MQIDKDVERTIHKYAVKNALDYGRASDGSVLNKVLSLHPELKSDIKSLALKVKDEVAKINSKSKQEIESEYSTYSEEFANEEQVKSEKSSKHNFTINGAEKGKFVTRFPPEPGGYMHIGHARPAFIEDELRKEYSGKLYLYFDDTNPDNERQEFVDAIKEDLAWLGIKFDKEYYASDYIPKLYEYAKDAISKEKAYVCTCAAEKVSENRNLGIECAHKSQTAAENIELWNSMLDGGLSGAILRLNSDIKALNTTLRDPTLFRIKHAEHYRQGSKFFVWPTYDFCTPIVDSLNGITDVIRSKEYEQRDELYFIVLDILGMEKPRITSISRLEITNNLTSKRKIRELIVEKKIEGYDDLRLVTVRAIKRRGITPQAVKELALSSGIGKSETSVGIDVLLNSNRRILDPLSKRLFFIEQPIEVHVKGLPAQIISMRLHPNADLGKREYKPDEKILIDSKEALGAKSGETLRLKEAYNIAIDKISDKLIEATYLGNENINSKKIVWMNKSGSTKCELLEVGDLLKGEEFNSESLKVRKGYVEGYAASLKEGDIVQFEKYGTYKLESKSEMKFISL